MGKGNMGAFAGLREQLLEASCARSLQRSGDPAASCHNLQIGFALQAHLKLVQAVARPD